MAFETRGGITRPDPLVLVNGRILRHRHDRRSVYLDPTATGARVEYGIITAIGEDRDVLGPTAGRAEVIDVRGGVIAPGFIDAHIHAFDCALATLRVSLLPPAVDRLQVLKERLADQTASTPVDGWVVGEGYDDMRLAEFRHPTRRDLDEAVPDRPAIVTRVCGHMSVANSRALDLAGVGVGIADPSGGAVIRDAAGRPTGLLLEEAQSLVLRLVPPPGVPQIVEALGRAARKLLRHGVTTICEALLGAFHPREAEIWSQVLADDWSGPNIRFLADARLGDALLGTGLPVIGTKLFADGVVTGRTAAVSQPFERSDDTGMLIHEPDALAKLVSESAARGLPVGIHAMGDRAIRVSVEAIDRLGPETIVATSRCTPDGTRVAPFRIEHCSLPTDESLRKMQALGIVPVPQPVFLFAEGEAYRTQLGDDRCARAYPLRTMIDLGLRPALSSDAPATSLENAIDPWPGIIAAATRRTWAGSQLGVGESVSVAEAIACSTTNGAAALSMNGRAGSVDVGMDADLIVLPDDPLSAPNEELGSLRPNLVLVKGRIMYKADG
jgi:predicted amidohydrolase YtcJ